MQEVNFKLNEYTTKVFYKYCVQCSQVYIYVLTNTIVIMCLKTDCYSVIHIILVTIQTLCNLIYFYIIIYIICIIATCIFERQLTNKPECIIDHLQCTIIEGTNSLGHLYTINLLNLTLELHMIHHSINNYYDQLLLSKLL